MANQVLRIEGIIGDATTRRCMTRCIDWSMPRRVEYVTLGPDDMLRRRLRVTTDRGSECAIALSRQEKLFDGAVLLLDRDRAVIVRAHRNRLARLEPLDTAAAIELGYCSGNMHWRVSLRRIGSAHRLQWT